MSDLALSSAPRAVPQPMLFADGIMDVNINAGVARLTLAQQGADGKPLMAGQLIMPLSQLPGFANSIIVLLKQLEAKMRESQAAAPAAELPADPAQVAGSFRFG